MGYIKGFGCFGHSFLKLASLQLWVRVHVKRGRCRQSNQTLIENEVTLAIPSIDRDRQSKRPPNAKTTISGIRTQTAQSDSS